MRAFHYSIVLFFIFIITTCSVAQNKLTLSKNGKTDYIIVLPDKPTVVEQTAANELAEHLKAVTGANFSIQKETKANASKSQILVGNSQRAKLILPNVNAAQLPYDGIVVKSIGKTLILLGHPQRGTLYAVNTFLEDVVGIRWWTSTESFIPQKPTLNIPEQNIQYAPDLINREAFYLDPITNGVFASRMKCNGHNPPITEEYGGHNLMLYDVHSFFKILPPDKYFTAHPDWYSEIDGVRTYRRGQLCLTNDAMRKELTRNALEAIRKNPGIKFISISQNDNWGYCRCKHCKAIAEEEGSQSGPLIRFVNQVAEDIEKEFPDVWVETLAYGYTENTPKHVKPRKNVVIRFCSGGSAFAQPLGEGEQNKPLRDEIEKWSHISGHLFIWDYVTNFGGFLLPHPNLRVLAPNIRFFIKNHAISLFEQGDFQCAAGDFVRMRAWVISHLIWNPALDDKKLFDEFITGYYGINAAPYIKEYWKLLLDRAEQSGVYLNINLPSTNGWLDPATLDKAVNLMNKAVSVTKDETLRKRILRDKLPIDHVLLKEYPVLRRKADVSGTPFVGLTNPKFALDDFFSRCKQSNITTIRENDRAFDLYEKSLREQYIKYPEPEICKGLPKNSWFDVQNFVDYRLFEGGTWTFLINDAKASDGQAIKMSNATTNYLNYVLDETILDMRPSGSQIAETPVYRIYAATRCEVGTNDSITLTCGVHDEKTKTELGNKSFHVSAMSGTEYHWLDIGAFALKPNPSTQNSYYDRQYLWFSLEHPDKVSAIYIDRIVIVREK